VLLVALVYLGRVGALDVASPAERRASRKRGNDLEDRRTQAA